MSQDRKDLSSLPFHERRYVAVVSEEKYDEWLSLKGESESSGSWWPVLGVIGSAVIPGGLLVRGGIALTSLVLAAATSENAEIAKKSVSAGDASKRPKASSFVIMATPDQMTGFNFLSGSSEVGQIYAANPVSDETYYTVESYNDDIIDHKLSELETLLNALGSKHYEIKYEDSEDYSFIISGKVGKGAIDASVDGEKIEALKRRFERRGTSDGRDPEVPNGLKWLAREPSWESLARSRTLYGRKDYHFSFYVENSLKISASTIANIQSVLKFEASVSSMKNRSVTLSVTGSF